MRRPSQTQQRERQRLEHAQHAEREPGGPVAGVEELGERHAWRRELKSLDMGTCKDVSDIARSF